MSPPALSSILQFGANLGARFCPTEEAVARKQVHTPQIELARIRPGANPVGKNEKKGGHSPTFKGLIDTNQGEKLEAFIKDIRPKELANELFASVVGQALNLPIPRTFLAIVGNGDLSLSHALSHPGGNDKITLAIEFTAFDRAVPNDQVWERLIKSQHLAATLWFDEWLANVDRKPDHILCVGAQDFALIDHGHCFGSDKWQAATLDSTKSFSNGGAARVSQVFDIDERSKLLNKVHDVADQAQDIDLQMLALATHLPMLLDSNDLTAMIDFADTRRNHASGLLEAHLGLSSLV